ncbi:hypothetical protein MPTK1_6g02150 [Marchantia polymorpha subsp. ruderalis]|uniref:Uncharacterized protein n=2 Tax=Marchantia polymorpha TaxID=3197 RepID=A0AAF6BMN0_MARPO|nr:hypothetical protein MARPO_0248s0001 [Marchantia polymorpha]BBN13264.1 hypothetical protein Mp_6g02150 [Marchantia polymorpha subsp. ruderalis]|eukprot:PTQ26984.1 hypothetical protein MARPO_0248s0001 [Marchantia polymorpha]
MGPNPDRLPRFRLTGVDRKIASCTGPSLAAEGAMESKGLPLVGTSKTAPVPAVPGRFIPENAPGLAAANDHGRAATGERAAIANRYRYSEVSGTISTVSSDGRDDASRRRTEVKKTSHSGGETVQETVYQMSGLSWQVRSITTIEKNRNKEITHRETKDSRGNLR